jgi:hypothetical protein
MEQSTNKTFKTSQDFTLSSEALEGPYAPAPKTTIELKSKGNIMNAETIADSSNALMAANFLSGTILVCLSILVIAGTILILNNIFVKYWKPIRVFTFVPVNDHTGEVVVTKTEPKMK